MSMDVKGKVTHILPVQSGVSKAGKEWSKQEFVIESEEQFPKNICFTLFGDKLSLLNGIKPGMQVEVFFNVESREFSGKWYHNINAWKISPVQSESDGHPGFSSDDIPPPAFDNDQEPPVDDLPF
ncbi:MAG: DUF3127 domain-containing protein [Prolixibacteraceae bacterium]|nr:DUF3127 domain-containing protein [Prolixibacteraceae bacterium]